MTIYQFSAKSIDGSTVNMKSYEGKVLLIVNTASRCGYTKQYSGLEELYKNYKDRGFEILGFPCNQFGGQEPDEDAEILNFCTMTFNVSFPLFSKIEVNGDSTHPLYVYLKNANPGILGTEAIKWNFTKFLIDRSGTPRARFAPATEPETIRSEIEKLL
jgi:glutathione peroxidase